MSKLKAAPVAGAHTWITESRAPHGPEQRFEDGWHAGACDVASYRLRIADTTGRGLGASSTMLVATFSRPPPPPRRRLWWRGQPRVRRWTQRTS
ncbi:hypothetical protein [Streptomyces sp. NPDC006285]|uniref:hypothetical protein n=1 Tax=Streptomyces sp. NPDC006285 TaxID=3364742 RepID=UPI0036916A0B